MRSDNFPARASLRNPPPWDERPRTYMAFRDGVSKPPPLRGATAARLAGDERQRVAIGRAILSNPKILVMDEPLSSLDDARKAEILPLIEDLKSEFNLTTLYISHSIEEIARLADTLLLLDKGEMKAVGPISDILNRLDLIPFAGGYDAGTLIEATVTAYEPGHPMLTLETESGRKLYITGRSEDMRRHGRSSVHARDVAFALH